jgi:hypothetical protein
MFTHVTRELNWKVYLEAAQTYERANDNEVASDFQANSVIHSPDNLKWKVWLIGSRIEYKFGNSKQTRMLIEKCCAEVP